MANGLAALMTEDVRPLPFQAPPLNAGLTASRTAANAAASPPAATSTIIPLAFRSTRPAVVPDAVTENGDVVLVPSPTVRTTLPADGLGTFVTPPVLTTRRLTRWVPGTSNVPELF